MWHRCKNNCAFLPSRLARALWIEGLHPGRWQKLTLVEARESLVDRRTLKFIQNHVLCITSRLARALWIEGLYFFQIILQHFVEARESLVDRRRNVSKYLDYTCRSRLARALWIEGIETTVQALRKIVEARESLVDRRWKVNPYFVPITRRGSREPCGSKACIPVGFVL